MKTGQVCEEKEDIGRKVEAKYEVIEEAKSNGVALRHNLWTPVEDEAIKMGLNRALDWVSIRDKSLPEL